jgi:predicted ABC-type exoprotein transport system permease subunit
LELFVKEEAVTGRFYADFLVKILKGEAGAVFFEALKKKVREEPMLGLMVRKRFLVCAGCSQ